MRRNTGETPSGPYGKSLITSAALAKPLGHEMEKPSEGEPQTAGKSIDAKRLVELSTAVAVVALEAEFRREFGETVRRIVFLVTALTARALIRRFVGALVGRSPEGDQFIDTVAHALDHTASTINEPHGESSIITFIGIPVDHTSRDFLNSVNEVTDSATEFTGSRVFGGRRGLDISHCGAHQACN
jgi:hypothetical protein